MDEKSFEDLMADMGVTPLEQEHRRSKPVASKEPRRSQSDDADRALFIRAVEGMSEPPRSDASAPTPAAPFQPKKIKRWPGVLPKPDEILDLHGQTRQAASDLLAKHIKAAFLNRDDWVWIVTGKGVHSPGERGVLGPLVERWIQQHGRRYVQAFGEAPRNQGGRGVWVVRMRRD